MNDIPWVPDRGPIADPSAQTCHYQTNPDPGCGRPGTWHVRWDQPRTSITCDEHMKVIQERWLYLDRHSISSDCAMPGAAWLPDRCEVPGSPASAVEAVVRSPCHTHGSS